MTGLDFRKYAVKLLVIGLALSFIPLAPASAVGQLTSRKVFVANSAPSASTNYTYTFNPTGTTTVKSLTIQACDTAGTSCTQTGNVVGFSWASVVAADVSVTGYGTSGATVSLTGSTQYLLKISLSTSATGNASSPITVTISNNHVVNPTATNASYYFTATTFSDAAYTTSLDAGNVAASTAQPVVVTGTMPESLVFTTGQTIGTPTNCSTVSGSTVNLSPYFSSLAASTGTSVFCLSTNAANGITVQYYPSGQLARAGGATPIPNLGAVGAQGASATTSNGTSGFGFNLTKNGASLGSTTAQSDYDGTGFPSNYRFYSTGGDTLVSTAGTSKTDTWNCNYIVNVSGDQAAGIYSTTLTFVATATF